MQWLWLSKKISKEGKMTPEKIKQLTPDGYGGDFELTMEVEDEDKNY